MSILFVQDIFEALHDAGLNVSLASEGRLSVFPASRLTPDLRILIRCNKTVLLNWFIAAATKDPAASEMHFEENLQKAAMAAVADDSAPNPPADPNAWRELAQAYYAHHLVCSTCRAAGRGSTYGLRCGVGATLWTNYQTNL